VLVVVGGVVVVDVVVEGVVDVVVVVVVDVVVELVVDVVDEVSVSCFLQTRLALAP
jgi:hypothetical protein